MTSTAADIIGWDTSYPNPQPIAPHARDIARAVVQQMRDASASLSPSDASAGTPTLERIAEELADTFKCSEPCCSDRDSFVVMSKDELGELIAAQAATETPGTYAPDAFDIGAATADLVRPQPTHFAYLGNSYTTKNALHEQVLAAFKAASHTLVYDATAFAAELQAAVELANRTHTRCKALTFTYWPARHGTRATIEANGTYYVQLELYAIAQHQDPPAASAETPADAGTIERDDSPWCDEPEEDGTPCGVCDGCTAVEDEEFAADQTDAVERATTRAEGGSCRIQEIDAPPHVAEELASSAMPPDPLCPQCRRVSKLVKIGDNDTPSCKHCGYTPRLFQTNEANAAIIRNELADKNDASDPAAAETPQLRTVLDPPLAVDDDGSERPQLRTRQISRMMVDAAPDAVAVYKLDENGERHYLTDAANKVKYFDDEIEAAEYIGNIPDDVIDELRNFSETDETERAIADTFGIHFDRGE